MPVQEQREMMELRHDALLKAVEIVDPIVDNFEPMAYEITKTTGAILGPPLSRNTMTPGEQVVNMLLDVASWLMGDNR